MGVYELAFILFACSYGFTLLCVCVFILLCVCVCGCTFVCFSMLNRIFLFQVQTRTFSCGIFGTCNCGVAAREGDDVVVIDFCSGGPMSARFASQREPAFGTRLYMASSGRDFQVCQVGLYLCE